MGFGPVGMKPNPVEMPVIPISDIVIFPHMVVPLHISSPELIRLLSASLVDGSLIAFSFQKRSKAKSNTITLSRISTACRIVQLSISSPGKAKVVVEGIRRVEISEKIAEKPYPIFRVFPMEERTDKNLMSDVLVQSVLSLLKVCVSLGKSLPPYMVNIIDGVDSPSKLADLVASYVSIPLDEKQAILEVLDPMDRLKKVFLHLSNEVTVLQTEGRENRIKAGNWTREEPRGVVKGIKHDRIDPTRREEGHPHNEIQELLHRIKSAGMPNYAERVALKELKRLEKISPATAEYTVSHTYLDYLISMPWNKRTEDNLDIERAEEVLNEDHYGLEEAKERILEFLSVRKLKNSTKGPILCFMGPPGVGKTSLGRSIARALGRKFIRISLGGLKDEAEIRGHRRTYVGALPGKIIQEIKRCGVKNPVFLLDEIDKIGQDFRGDPAAALLEVLDPEQNSSFKDHYLEVPFDLSEVFFIATGNYMATVPAPLKDRMEVINIPGYTEEEKLEIAKRHLIPKQTKECGLENHGISWTDDAIKALIKEYTKEAGVRNLERSIGSVLRKLAKRIAKEEPYPKTITKETVKELLGPQKFFHDELPEEDSIGVVCGMAWTESGGEIIIVEASKMPGKKGLKLTGSLGDVMKESAETALSFIRSNAEKYGIDPEFFNKIDIHIHVPSGAVPKDGPSAGVTIATAMVSLLTGRKVKRDIAMTGEITLTGRILPVGGIKEKVLAARRAGVRKVLLPSKNSRDLIKIPNELKENIEFIFVDTLDEVLEEAIV